MNFLRLDQVIQRTGLSRSTIYEHLNAGRFPRPVRISERAIAFVESEIEAWQEARIAERDVHPG